MVGISQRGGREIMKPPKKPYPSAQIIFYLFSKHLTLFFYF